MSANEGELKLRTRSVDETVTLAATIGEHAFGGMVVGLAGPLGAGKTHFTKGLARALGVEKWQRVNSPTFTLMNVYAGASLQLVHVDLYRIESEQDIPQDIVEALGDSETVCVVEWADRYPGLLGGELRRLEIEISHGEGDVRGFNIVLRGFDAKALTEAIGKLPGVLK